MGRIRNLLEVHWKEAVTLKQQMKKRGLDTREDAAIPKFHELASTGTWRTRSRAKKVLSRYADVATAQIKHWDKYPAPVPVNGVTDYGREAMTDFHKNVTPKERKLLKAYRKHYHIIPHVFE